MPEDGSEDSFDKVKKGLKKMAGVGMTLWIASIRLRVEIMT